MSDSQACPICRVETPPPTPDPNRPFVAVYECPNCGRFHFDERLTDALFPNVTELAKLSYAIRKRQARNEEILVNERWCIDVLDNTVQPNPSQMADNFIQWLGDWHEQNGIGEHARVETNHLRASIGAVNVIDVHYVFSGLFDNGLIAESEDKSRAKMRGLAAAGGYYIRLTFSGWEHFESLRRENRNSRMAFMALQFGDTELNEVFKSCFRPAVERAGFSLEKMDDNPEPGIIDVRIEVEIRRSRFVVADLTHENRGAYWEAGFATGLDRPVIYTCREDVAERIHFDASHRTHIKWDPARLDDAGKLLTATIRAALPTEAILEDK